MSSRLLNFNQILPVPTAQYSMQLQEALIRAVYNLQQNIQTPGEQRGTKITLSMLPTVVHGLEVGALYRSGNQVFITLADSVSPPGTSGTGAIGSVTIAIT